MEDDVSPPGALVGDPTVGTRQKGACPSGLSMHRILVHPAARGSLPALGQAHCKFLRGLGVSYPLCVSPEMTINVLVLWYE
jgi:hypothetical protein